MLRFAYFIQFGFVRWRGGDDGGDRRGPGPDREPPGYGSREGASGRDEKERWGRKPGGPDDEDGGRWTDERRRRPTDMPPPPRAHYGERDRDRDQRTSGDYHRTGGGGGSSEYYHGGGGGGGGSGYEPEWMADEAPGGEARRGVGSGGAGGGGREERPQATSRAPAGPATRLTAADVERERQAFRAMANKEKVGLHILRASYIVGLLQGQPGLVDGPAIAWSASESTNRRLTMPQTCLEWQFLLPNCSASLQMVSCGS